MTVQAWTFLIVGLSFALYIAIAVISRAKSTRDFYVASKEVHPVANGMATAADWMSAASFIGMAGLISFLGADGAVYLMGWTGGYVLLALLLAPYLRKFGRFTVPDFIGDRYEARTARMVAVVCAIFISFTYVAGQMRGVGIVFSRFLEVDIAWGVIIGMALVFFYAVLGGMKGITYTQVAQYCVLIFAFLVPAIFLSLMFADIAIPQVGLGRLGDDGQSLLQRLDGISTELGFGKYTDYKWDSINIAAITAALMLGTAGLPHVIIRFYTVRKVRDARSSAGWALLFIAILYTTAPAIAVFSRTNLLQSVPGTAYVDAPEWLGTWEDVGLIAWQDRDNDGVITYAPGQPFNGKPTFAKHSETHETLRGEHGQRLITNESVAGENELYVDRDIMVLANPEIAGLPNWVTALVAAGGLAAALSTAAGLLLVISSAVSHDLLKGAIMPGISEKRELLAARIAAGGAVVIAGLIGIWPPDYVAAIVAFAFGLAASSFFPAIVMGIFSKRMNGPGAISGMIAGIVFTTCYIIWFKFIDPGSNNTQNWWFGISPEGIGVVGMLVNFAVAIPIAALTQPPSPAVQTLVQDIRIPGDS
ncbi:MAG: sodium:solute symporter family protein [Planctomycetota bacterium]|nr:sodium:solute symporter family protein [Planctomycetota bacterium]